MPDNSTFDELVQSLSNDERRAMLERIQQASILSAEPLFDPTPIYAAPAKTLEQRISRLSPLSRLLLRIRHMLTGSGYQLILDSRDLRRVARDVESDNSSLVDCRRRLLLPPFLDQILSLKCSARYFYEVLTRSFDRDREAFAAFLASIDMPDFNKQLMERTDSAAWLTLHPGAGQSEVRQAVFDAYQDVFDFLPAEEKETMHQDYRSLLFLRDLAVFPFDKLISAFSNGTEIGSSAKFADVKDLLISLNNILFSLSIPPTTELMESIYMFVDSASLKKGEFEAEAALTRDLKRAGEALGKIRFFNGAVPLTEIIKLITRNPSYLPAELPGGEDWLNLYQHYWESRIDEDLNSLFARKHTEQVQSQIRHFVGDVEPRQFEHIASEESDKAPTIRMVSTIHFLDAFSRGLFMKQLNSSLNLILMEGEFYRKENRIEFTDAYDVVVRMPETLLAFDAKLGPDGDIGRAWCHAALEIVPIPIKHRNMAAIQEKANHEAETIIRNADAAFKSISSILCGILRGDGGGKYDSISNLSLLSSKTNNELVKKLGIAKERFDTARVILEKISGMDFREEEH